jgi:hypothetical protein
MFGTQTFSFFLRDHRRPVLLFLLSLCSKLVVFIFLLWWFRFAGHLPLSGGQFPLLGGDSTDFGKLSENLFYHGTFSSSESVPLIPESFRLPGYSFFLYPFFFLPLPLIFGVLAQLFCASGSVVLTYLLAKNYLSENIAFWGALFMVFEPTSVFNSVQVLSDTVFVFTMLASFYLLLSTYTSKKSSLSLQYSQAFFSDTLFLFV